MKVDTSKGDCMPSAQTMNSLGNLGRAGKFCGCLGGVASVGGIGGYGPNEAVQYIQKNRISSITHSQQAVCACTCIHILYICTILYVCILTVMVLLICHRVDGSSWAHVMTGRERIIGSLDSTASTTWPHLLTWRRQKRRERENLIYVDHYKFPKGGGGGEINVLP